MQTLAAATHWLLSLVASKSRSHPCTQTLTAVTGRNDSATHHVQAETVPARGAPHRKFTTRVWLVAVATVIWCLTVPAAADAQEGTVELRWGDRLVQGLPLDWSAQHVTLLSRDGRYWSLHPASVQEFRQVADRFVPYTMSEMRALLRAEFGRSYDVTSTTHYVVVHPAGQSDVWAPRFENFYRAFVRYFQIRGWAAREPQFPLVAVVFPDRQQYAEYARRMQIELNSEIVGYYCPRTNRVVLYDLSSTAAAGKQVTWETVFHEAAHQVAFNTGIHDRRHPPPRWVVEGLGMLFEVETTWHPQLVGTGTSRVNSYRLQRMKRYLARRPPDALAQMIASDKLFDVDPDGAYAEAWAFTFFLSETRPRLYLDYLQKTTGLANQDRDVSERWKPFVDVFGNNLPMLEAHYMRFLAQLTP